MKSLLGRVALLLVHAVISASAAIAQPIEVIVQYTQPTIFDPAYKRIKDHFEAENPDIRIRYRGPQKDYDAGIQALLREATTGDLPHIAYVGLANLRVAAESNIAIDLARLAAADGATLEAQGWTLPLQGLGQVDKRQIGLPFAVSMPVVYYNADLVRRAGGDPANMPRDWDGLLRLAGKIGALGGDVAGMYHTWTGASGPWLVQGLVYGAGGEMMLPGTDKVAFGDDKGRYAIGLYRRMVDEGRMPLITDTAARQQFIAGKMGLFLDSISRLSNFEKAIGERFTLQTSFYPTKDGRSGGLVTGGAAGIVTTAAAKDKAVLAAAWKYLKFASGPRGTNELIRNVGYMPVNALALQDPALLKGYFDDKPRHKTAVDQLPQLREWFQFPGPNGVKINDVIMERLQAVVDKSETPEGALAALVIEVNRLLPR
jgi:multiple sugar transport system substrate-binding protein